MTRFEWFESGQARIALELGVLSASLFAKYIHFKVYLGHRQAGNNKMEAIRLTADEVGTSVTSVWKAVYFFGN